MSEISDLVARLIAAGSAADVAAVVVVEAIDLGMRRSAEFRRQSVESPTDAAAERRRNADKLRKRLKAAERNSAAENLRNSADGAEKRCDLSSSLLPFPPQKESGIREESKGRARGSRLLPASPLADADRKFAADNGVRNPDALWVEFIDYWASVPGQRGVKLDWSATWRNRVRQVATKGGTAAASRLAPNRIEGII